MTMDGIKCSQVHRAVFGRWLPSDSGLRLFPAEQKNGCEMSAWEGVASSGRPELLLLGV